MENLARHGGRIAYEIYPPLDRHKVDDCPVLRRERFDFLSSFVVGFTEGVLCILGREQVARLGKRDPARLMRWQCRQRAGKRGLGCSVELRSIGRSGSASPK